MPAARRREGARQFLSWGLYARASIVAALRRLDAAEARQVMPKRRQVRRVPAERDFASLLTERAERSAGSSASRRLIDSKRRHRCRRRWPVFPLIGATAAPARRAARPKGFIIRAIRSSRLTYPASARMIDQARQAQVMK